MKKYLILIKYLQFVIIKKQNIPSWLSPKNNQSF